jgi:hypothetical protein
MCQAARARQWPATTSANAPFCLLLLRDVAVVVLVSRAEAGLWQAII